METKENTKKLKIEDLNEKKLSKDPFMSLMPILESGINIETIFKNVPPDALSNLPLDIKKNLSPWFIKYNFIQLIRLMKMEIDYKGITEKVLKEVSRNREKIFENSSSKESLDFEKLKDSWIRTHWIKHFAINHRLFLDFSVRDSKYGGKGLFANTFFHAGMQIGTLSGLLIQSMKNPEYGKNGEEYVFHTQIKKRIDSFNFGLGCLSIDTSRQPIGDEIKEEITDTGRINHKPSFKRILSDPNLDGNSSIFFDTISTVPIPYEWEKLFAQVDVDELLNMKLIYDVNEDEEIFFDYGPGYWKDRKEKPKWDLSNCPRDFIDFISDTKQTPIPLLWDYLLDENLESEENLDNNNFASKEECLAREEEITCIRSRLLLLLEEHEIIGNDEVKKIVETNLKRE